jgi:hypothetical protein
LPSDVRALKHDLASDSGADVAEAKPRRPSMLGYNMDFPGEWTNMPPFIDQMKNARAFRGECSAADPKCDPSAHLDLDDEGWVKSLAYKDDPLRAYSAVNVILNTSSDRPDIDETFVVTWKGNGDVRVPNGGEPSVAAEQRRLTFQLRRGDTLLQVRDIDRADPVRDIRVFRADREALLEAGEEFDPDMLAFLAPFGSLRFMDWMQSNSYGQCSGGTRHGETCYSVVQESCEGGGVCVMPGRWEQRPRADQPSYQASGQYLDNAHPERGTKVGGYPLETLVALANRTRVDPHFNMPADSDDEYVGAFARYVKEHLEPGLRASVEYSNEVWNWGFPQAQYADTRGRELSPDEGTAWVQYAAGRTSNMCRIWKEVFAGEEQRVRCLISPQTDWHLLAETVLECPAWVASHPGSGPCYQNADAINITGYFSGCLHRNEGTILGWLGEGRQPALDRAFEQLEHGGLIADCADSLDDTIAAYSYFRDLAAARGLELYVYESGTHFAYDGDESVRQFLVDVTRDERMYELYRRNFASFLASGGSMFNVWGWVAPNDAWANSESVLDLGHPKYRAIADFAEGAAPVTR